MPGLLRMATRTAVVAGTATAVSNRVSRRQANRWSAQEDQQYQQQQDAQQQQQYAPPPPPAAAPATDTVTQLKELADLKSQGILTDAEFEAQKAKILAS
jgi:Short C-terminal domain